MMPSSMADLGLMPPPPSLTPKQLSLKRSYSDIDNNSEDGLSSTKRLKVAFDDKVDIHIMDDWTEKSFELVLEEVRQSVAPAAPAEKRNEQYFKLVHVLSQSARSHEAPSSKLLRKYITALKRHMKSFTKCLELVEAVLDLSWLGRDEAFVATYKDFLIDLSITQPLFAERILERLASKLERIPASVGRLPGERPVPKAVLLDRLHDVIKSLIRRIPSASNILALKLKRHFPSDLSTTRSSLQYQKNLLRLANDIPELNEEILALIMQRLVDIDVQIQRDFGDLGQDAGDNILKELEEEVEDSDDSDDDSVSESELTITKEEQELQDFKLKVAKVDMTQDLLFNHYDRLIRPKLDPNNQGYNQLIRFFDTFILPNRSWHAQFLLFHFSQQSSVYTQAFITHCEEKLEFKNARNHGVDRTVLNACAYLASFIARASRVSTVLVRYVFERLCDILERLRVKYEPDCDGPDRRKYMLYYTVSQAVLYIFCFRWRDLVNHTIPHGCGYSDDTSVDDLIADGQDLTWLPFMKDVIRLNINSKMNPLKVCSSEIVREFAKIAYHLRFAYVFSILEVNKRVILGISQNVSGSLGRGSAALSLGRRETAWDRKIGEAHHQVEAYFPFDPYHLPKSKTWLDGDYNDWVLPPGMRHENDDDDDDDENEEEEDEGSDSDDEASNDSDVEPNSDDEDEDVDQDLP